MPSETHLFLACYAVFLIAALEMARWALMVVRRPNSPKVAWPLLTSYISTIVLSAAFLISFALMTWWKHVYVDAAHGLFWLATAAVAMKVATHYYWRITR